MEDARELFDKNKQVWDDLRDGLRKAQEKHKIFAEGPYEALGKVSEKLRDLTVSINKNDTDERIMHEALDLLVVVWRFYRRDWEMPEEEA